jgi:hypothetical protein
MRPAVAFHISGPPLGRSFPALNGQIVKDLLSPVLLKGWKLIYAVDEWICTAKAKGSAGT